MSHLSLNFILTDAEYSKCISILTSMKDMFRMNLDQTVEKLFLKIAAECKTKEDLFKTIQKGVDKFSKGKKVDEQVQWLQSSRQNLIKIKESLERRLPAQQEMFDRVVQILLLPPDVPRTTATLELIMNFRKDFAALKTAPAALRPAVVPAAPVKAVLVRPKQIVEKALRSRAKILQRIMIHGHLASAESTIRDCLTSLATEYTDWMQVCQEEDRDLAKGIQAFIRGLLDQRQTVDYATAVPSLLVMVLSHVSTRPPCHEGGAEGGDAEGHASKKTRTE